MNDRLKGVRWPEDFQTKEAQEELKKTILGEIKAPHLKKWAKRKLEEK